jgi:site-specific DNA recombinase
MSNQKPIGIWLRVSTEDQVKGESLDVHAARAKAYAESRAWEIKETYRLEAVSGKSVIGHREARRMLADIKSGHISGLIFSKLARLSRNNRELLDFAATFQEHNADLISLAENIDTSTPAGRMFFNMLAAMAAWEREEIVARVRASVPIRATLGRSLGGQAQYGYAWVDKKFVLVPEEAAVRKLMYELFLETRKLRTLARTLNDRGYRTRNGKLWAGSSIERLLRDPTAKGQKRYNYTKILDGERAWVHKPESDWVLHDCPRIVSDELWDEVNSLLTQKKLSGERQTKNVTNLFAGICYCGCSHKMSVPSGMKKYVCNKNGCKRRIEIDTLEVIFQSELDTFANAPETLQSNKQEAEKLLADTGNLITSCEGQLQRVNGQIDTLLDLYQSGALDETGFRGRYESLRDRNAELAIELPKLREKNAKLLRTLAAGAEVQAETKDISIRYITMSFAEKRRLIESVVERVTIGNDEVEFTYLFDPTR